MIPPANTGKDNNNKNAVINTAHTNNGNLCISNFGDLILIIVVMKLIAPNKELTPAKCNEKIAKSTLPPECASIPDNGGYTVHPVPAPFSTSADATNNVKEGCNSQKLMLFNLGNPFIFYKCGLCLHPIILSANNKIYRGPAYSL